MELERQVLFILYLEFKTPEEFQTVENIIQLFTIMGTEILKSTWI
jgi:hypothetical protein